MYQKLSTFFYVFCLLMLTSCDTINRGPEKLSEQDFRTVKINNNYSVDLPNYLSEGNLNTEASLQYQHLFKETYVIVIDENIQEATESLSFLDTFNSDNSFMQNYIDFQKDSFNDGSKVISMANTKDLTVNGLKAKQFDMVLDIPDLDEHISYLITFYQSHDRIYMLMSWTLEERMMRYMDTFKTIANSFKVQKRRSKTKRKS